MTTLTVADLGARYATAEAREADGVGVVLHNGGRQCGLTFHDARLALWLWVAVGDDTFRVRVLAVEHVHGGMGAAVDAPVWWLRVDMETVLEVGPLPERTLTPQEAERRRVAAKRRRLGRMQMERTRRRSPTAPA